MNYKCFELKTQIYTCIKIYRLTFLKHTLDWYNCFARFGYFAKVVSYYVFHCYLQISMSVYCFPTCVYMETVRMWMVPSTVAVSRDSNWMKLVKTAQVELSTIDLSLVLY